MGVYPPALGLLKGIPELRCPDRKDKPPPRRWRFVAALRCAPLLRCSLPGAVEPNASPVGSHEAHNALVETNR